MGDQFRLPNLCAKKQVKGRKLFFVLQKVTNVKLTEQCSGVSIKIVCLERGRLMLSVYELVSNLNHGEYVLIRRNL